MNEVNPNQTQQSGNVYSGHPAGAGVNGSGYARPENLSQTPAALSIPDVHAADLARSIPLYSTASLDGGDEEGIDIRAFWAMLRRRKFILLAVFVVVIASTIALTWSAHPIYQTSASIMVDTSTGSGASSDDLPAVEAMMGMTRTRSLETQIEVLKSSPIMAGALRRLPSAQRQSIKKFNTMTITPTRNTDVISVTVASYDPEAASAFANAMCREYMEQNQNQNRQQVHTATAYVASQLKLVRARLDKSRRDLLAFKQTQKTVDLGAESTAKIARLTQAQNDLQAGEGERLAAVAQLAKVRQQLSTGVAAPIVPGGIVRSPSTEATKALLNQLENDRIAALEEYNPQSTKVKILEGKIRSLKQRLQKSTSTEVSTWQPNPIRQNLTNSILTLEGTVRSLESRNKALRASVAQAKADVARLPGQEYMLGQLTTDNAALEQTYQMLNEKYQSLRITEEARLANARILDEARVPVVPVSPRKMRNLLMAFCASLFLGIVLAALTDRLDDRVHSEEDAERASGLTTLAYVPYIKDSKGQSLLHNHGTTSPLLESYRMLRTNLEFAGVDDPIRCVAVTSSQPNEGKSTSSLDIAIVMAMDGKKVILVDLDLRRPTLHRLFELPNSVGFTNVVAGTSSLEEALHETSVPNLYVLTSGPVPPNPPELLNSKAGRNCIQKIRDAADFTVLDTPPGLVMADARIIASIAGASLLVISVKEASTREIARTSAQLVQTGTRVLGTILNKITAESGGYYGYYYYRNYGNYVNNEKDGKPTKEKGLVKMP